MNVLELVQAAYGEMGIPEPASLLTTGEDEMQAKRLLYAQARHLRNQRSFPQLKRIKTLTTTTASTYQLPQDFFAAIAETGWDRTNRHSLGSSGSDIEYNQLTYGSGIGGAPYNYRIFGPDSNPNSTGGQFNIYPAPANNTSIGFEYITKTMFTPPYWTASETGITSTPAEYRFVNELILKATAITTGTTSTTAPTAAGVDGGVTWAVVSAPYETILVNEDLSLFDDDIMIAGIKWRYRQSKDQEFSSFLAEHNALKDKAKTRWHGSFTGRLDNKGANLFSGRLRTPYKSWSI